MDPNYCCSGRIAPENEFDQIPNSILRFPVNKTEKNVRKKMTSRPTPAAIFLFIIKFKYRVGSISFRQILELFRRQNLAQIRLFFDQICGLLQTGIFLQKKLQFFLRSDVALSWVESTGRSVEFRSGENHTTMGNTNEVVGALQNTLKVSRK